MELWKSGGNKLKIHLLELLNDMRDTIQLPQEWEAGLVINIHKKGTKSKWENYRGITLLRTAYKLFANVINNRLNERFEDEIAEKLCGFRKGRTCTVGIFTVQQIIENRKEHNLPLFFFIYRLRKGI